MSEEYDDVWDDEKYIKESTSIQEQHIEEIKKWDKYLPDSLKGNQKAQEIFNNEIKALEFDVLNYGLKEDRFSLLLNATLLFMQEVCKNDGLMENISTIPTGTSTLIGMAEHEDVPLPTISSLVEYAVEATREIFEQSQGTLVRWGHTLRMRCLVMDPNTFTPYYPVTMDIWSMDKKLISNRNTIPLNSSHQYNHRIFPFHDEYASIFERNPKKNLKAITNLVGGEEDGFWDVSSEEQSLLANNLVKSASMLYPYSIPLNENGTIDDKLLQQPEVVDCILSAHLSLNNLFCTLANQKISEDDRAVFQRMAKQIKRKPEGWGFGIEDIGKLVRFDGEEDYKFIPNKMWEQYDCLNRSKTNKDEVKVEIIEDDNPEV